MALVYKVLGQSNPSASTNTDLYTCGSANGAVCSTLVICNQASSAATFNIAVRPAGASILAKHYLSYQNQIQANDTITLTIGMTLANTDVVTINANTATCSFNLFGSELT